ncbi:MAG: hypothetical protein AAF086_07555 [Planctomycetota bacterium]
MKNILSGRHHQVIMAKQRDQNNVSWIIKDLLKATWVSGTLFIFLFGLTVAAGIATRSFFAVVVVALFSIFVCLAVHQMEISDD